MRRGFVPCLFACVLFSQLSCSNEGGNHVVSDRPESTFETERPFNPGILHNEILEQIDAASLPAGAFTPEEFLENLVDAANQAYEPYGPSRLLSIDDARVILDVVYIMRPLFDFSLQDSLRMDPAVALTYWYNHGRLTHPEFLQLRHLFGADDARTTGITAATVTGEAVSETVGLAASVLGASVEYWSAGAYSATNGKARIDRVPSEEELRKYIADGLGGTLGALMGSGPFTPLVAAGFSIVFTMVGESHCWPDPCGGGGSGDPPPCGGYNGIGPCP